MNVDVQDTTMNEVTPSHTPFLEPVPEGQKRCSRCKHIFPATLKYYSPASGRPDGLYSMCRDCKNKSWQACDIRRKERDKSNGHNQANTSLVAELQETITSDVTPSHIQKQEPLPVTIPEGYKRCPKCPEGQQWHPATPEYFHRNKANQDGLYYWCKTCWHEYKHSTKNHSERHPKDQLNGDGQLEQITKPRGTPDQCGSCGTTNGNILGDVDDATHEKYGYLCMKCYKLVRDFGKDLNRMRKAIGYVEKTRLSRVAHKKSPPR